MLKLPKGLKKKKKGKKSKKNQELFTEEELEQYKREQREKNKQLNSEELSAEAEEEYSSGIVGGRSGGGGGGPSTSNQSTSVLTTASSGSTSIGVTEKKSNTEDDEWLKFKALTTGIDTVLKKTQGDLDRIKESSFFQRVPTKVEKEQQLKQQQQEAEEAKRLQQEQNRENKTAGDNRTQGELTVQEKLAQAVVELSESEEESEEADDIFDTDYIDALTSGDVHLAYVPESPTEEELAGPDPFDTAYADKVIKGPEVSKRGKKIVNIGSAVEVLTGRVEKVSSASAIARRPRRGPQNLLLESFDEGSAIIDSTHDHLNVTTTEPIKTLLDDITDELPDAPIDLSVSLHLAYQSREQQQQQREVNEENTQSSNNILSEFDVFKLNDEDDDDDDEFAELAAESLNKKDEPINLVNSIQTLSSAEGEEGVTNWSAFEGEKAKGKPSRPPPPRPIGGPHVQQNQLNEKKTENEDFDITPTEEDDPFDTTFVEQVVKKVEDDDDDDDFDFDPRADEKKSIESNTKVHDLKIHTTDLLGGSNSDLTQIALAPIESANLSSPDFDPFDTTAVNAIVQPKSIELNLLEKELLSDTKTITTTTTTIKHSLSDPDFDPRADEIIQPNIEIEIKNNYELTARRKSSLSLNISGSNHPSNQKTVGFAVSDLLTSAGLGNTNNNNSNKIQKPLTPYPEKFEEERDCEDPFDTSFVPTIKPTDIELNILEKDLLTETKLKHSISDPDFDPRAETSASLSTNNDFTNIIPNTDLLGVEDEHNIKVLTPGTSDSVIGDQAEYSSNYLSDPFDTSSIDHNILPGKAELKLIENELLPAVQETEKRRSLSSFDTNTDSQELGLGDKVLTPQIPFNTSISIEEQDPFDTSFASNLAPGKTEIKLLESELIGK